MAVILLPHDQDLVGAILEPLPMARTGFSIVPEEPGNVVPDGLGCSVGHPPSPTATAGCGYSLPLGLCLCNQLSRFPEEYDLAVATMPTPDPVVVKRVSKFFSKEADSLRLHLASAFENDHSDLSYYVNAMAERLPDATARLPALKKTADDFSQHCVLFMEAANEVPAFDGIFDWAQRKVLQEDFNTNHPDFAERHAEFVKVINVYGIGPSSESMAIATINTRYSTYDDNARDHVIKQVYDRENAHLMFWDISFGLQLTGFSQTATRNLIRLASELTARVNSPMKESEAATMQKQLTTLNLAIAQLPIPNISPHRFDALRSAVDSFFEQRVGRLFDAA